MIEDQLESLIRSSLRKDAASAKIIDRLFAVYAPLSTLSAKIEMSYALGLVTEKMRKQLLMLKKIRNDFAHDNEVVAFTSPRYKAQFEAIKESFRPKEPERDIDNQLIQYKVLGDRVIERLAFCACMSELCLVLEAAERHGSARILALLEDEWYVQHPSQVQKCNNRPNSPLRRPNKP